MFFRKKPVVIEAIRYFGNVDEVVDFLGDSYTDDVETYCNRIPVRTLEGVIFASPGDWIIRGVKGECYPCKPDVFEMTYEPVTI